MAKTLKVVSNEQEDLDRRKRDSKVYELRIQGFTFDQIAMEVGFNGPSGAWQAYERIKNEMIFESVDEARKLELMRLDELQFSLWDRAITGDLPSANCVLKIMDRRAKLLGLDKPDKVEVNKWDFTGEDIEGEVQKIVTMMNEREEEFMARREAEVRQEMRSQFEIEKRLEKELSAKENTEKAKEAVMRLLNNGSDRMNEWKPSENS